MAIISVKNKQFGSISEWNCQDALRKSDRGALYISRYQNPGDAFRSLLQFDLERLPLDGICDTAYLKLYIYRNEINHGTIQAAVYPLTEKWDENTLTWDCRPRAADTPSQQIIIPADWKGFILFDISKLMSDWLDRIRENHGLVMAGDETRDALVAFASSAYPETDKHPRLILVSADEQKNYDLV